MMKFEPERLAGIHAATIVPMRTHDAQIDQDALASHLQWISHTPGIKGLLVNGHAGENFVLSLNEKRMVTRIARQIAPSSCFICSGVNHESSSEAAREATAMEEEGADGILIFPPNSWALGHSDDVVFNHHHKIVSTTRLPVLIYGAPVNAGSMAYSAHVISELVKDQRIVAIKDGSWEVAHYEANYRLIKSLRSDFVVMGSGDEHLLTSYIIGSEGSQVSLAAVIPDILVEFYEAVQASDWQRARDIHERIYLLSVAIYRNAPGGRATARLKACLKILGRLVDDAVRLPQPSASVEEYRILESALTHCGVL